MIALEVKKYCVARKSKRETAISPKHPKQSYKSQFYLYTSREQKIAFSAFLNIVYFAETCRCEKRINAVKRVLYPLITNQENDTFTKLVDSAITMCCSTCSSKQTSTYWTTDTGGEGIFSAEDVIKQLKLGIEVYAPQLQVVRTWDNSENSYGFGKFIPILKSPGITVLSKKPTPTEMANEGAKVLLKSLSRAYPILIISIIIVLLTGYLHWLNVSRNNNNFDHIPVNSCQSISVAIYYNSLSCHAYAMKVRCNQDSFHRLCWIRGNGSGRI